MPKTGVLEIGAGLRVRLSTSPARERGYITVFISPNENRGVNRNNMIVIARAAMARVPVFPGSNMPLQDTDVRVIKGGGAILVGIYGRTGAGASGFYTASERGPGGYRDVLTYDVSNAWLLRPGNVDNWKLKPIIKQQPLEVIRWNSQYYSDIRPTNRNTLQGKYNANPYTIDGTTYPAKSLRFDGEYTVHRKYGGRDQWTHQRIVTYDRLLWQNESYTYKVNAFALRFIKGPNVPIYNESDLVNFPNMP